MDEILMRIKTLENRVEFLILMEECLENKNKSFIQELDQVKEATTTILNILNLKHHNNVDKVINLCKQTKRQHQKVVTCIFELLDGRIALSCCGGAISLNQLNYETKEWTVLTQKNNAHDGIINSLCEINNKRILSSSD